jgi:hypothetical protein
MNYSKLARRKINIDGSAMHICDTSAHVEVKTRTASNSREFLKTLGSNRLIEMDYTGEYNIPSDLVIFDNGD